ncbi:MAG: SpaH/EbpB family LPXTG-anchored major pilin, partial [Faecousia sp.]
DTAAKGSLTIYKVDLTNAEKDGVWDSSYVSTGVYDQTVNDTLNSYALKDVEFTYLRVADVVQFTESTADGADFDHVETLYGISKTAGAELLSALGLANGANRYEKADSSDKLSASNYYYQSHVLTSALKSALEANATTVKNALEAYITANGGTAMPLTDTYGKTKAENLDLGLYLVVETKVPEMVTSTCNPFFISLPMTSGDGNGWIYDVTVYPKNLTGDPTLDKTLRESKDDTGKHNGTAGITDGYAAAGTASDGDIVDYQIISSLPSITSASTYLTAYTFADTLSKGITYNKNDVVLEFFTDAACTDSIAKWTETDGKFTVTYSTVDTGESKMVIEMTAEGLKEINTSKAVYAESAMVNSGYSDCTLRITYAATVSSSADVVYGANGNPNEVVLTWKRTSQDSYDTLKDAAKVYTYGLELTKVFSDGKGDFSKVQFVMQNKTDGYYLKAKLDETAGIYYVTDHVADKKDATRFVPISGDGKGKIIVKGLEDDEYIITEIKTADGYTLLKNAITVVITHENDSAAATVDGNQVNMLTDNGSANALAPLSVVNTSGFDLPATGDRGVWIYGLAGILLMAGSAACIVITTRKKSK